MSDEGATPSPYRKRRQDAALTIHEVAKLAGVSSMTVSRVFNSPDRVSPETLARVKQVVARTGYVPNLMAGGLRSSKSRLVVALIPTLSSPLFATMLEALTQALDDRGFQLMVGQIGYANSREAAMLESVIGRRPDGIVFNGIVKSDELRRRLIRSRIPVVETGDLTTNPLDMLVGFSHERTGQAACEYLVGRGRRRLAVISADDERAKRRVAAFVTAASMLGVPSPTVELVPAPARHSDGRRGLAKVLARRTDTDAVFCSSDLVALGVMTEAGVRGIRIPQSLAVMGLGDLDFSATLSPALTTCRVDAALMGRIVAQYIAARADGLPVPERVTDVGLEIVERDST